MNKLMSTTIEYPSLFIDNYVGVTESSLSNTWLFNPALQPPSFLAQLVPPGTTQSGSGGRKLMQLKQLYYVFAISNIIYGWTTSTSSTEQEAINQLNSIQATLDATAAEVNTVYDLVLGAESIQSLNSALSTMGIWIGNTNPYENPRLVGSAYNCIDSPTGNWESNLFGFTGSLNIQDVMREMACSFVSSSSVVGNAPPVSQFCTNIASVSGSFTGAVQVLLQLIVSCGDGGDSNYGYTDSSASNVQCAPAATAQSPQLLLASTMSSILSTALQVSQVCNNIASYQNSSSCASSDLTASFDGSFPSDFCNTFNPGLNNDVSLTTVIDYATVLTYNASTRSPSGSETGIPWSYYMWRSYQTSNYFSPSQNGLLGGSGVLSSEPSWANAAYGAMWYSNGDFKASTFAPSLFSNLNAMTIAPEGSVLLAASFVPTSCPWAACFYENIYNDKNGYTNLLNIASRTAQVTIDGAGAYSFVTNAGWAANPVDDSTPPIGSAAGASVPESVYAGVPNDCPFPYNYYTGSEDNVVTENNGIWNQYASGRPALPDEASCVLNPQYVSLMPVTMPVDYVAVGIGLVMWTCPNYPGAYSGANPGPVLGLQLAGRQILYNVTTGEASWGNVVKFDNKGYCGSAILQATNPISSSTPTMQGPVSGFYPALGSVNPASDNFIHYDVLQVYSDGVLNSIDLSTCTGGCIDCCPQGTGMWYGGTGFFYAQDITNTDGPAQPAFVQGASFWLNHNQLAIGTISAGSLYKADPIESQCYNWDANDLAWIDAGVEQSWVCQSHGTGFYFTQGNNQAFPGCGGCWCCAAAGINVTDPPPSNLGTYQS